jgi:phosphatidate cytidylyltransferase
LLPVDANLAVDAGVRLSAALAAGLGVIAFAERRHLRRLPANVLFLRWRTWAIAAPIYLAAAIGPELVAVGFIMALALQGMREYARLTGLPRSYRVFLFVTGVVSIPIAHFSLTLWRGMPPILLVLATLPAVLSQDTEKGAHNLAYAGLGFAYVPWLLGYFVLIREHVSGGPGILLALGTAVAASDVFAFTTGKLFGRHLLAPRLSPNKTWEGVAGNFLGAYAGFTLMSFALPTTLDPHLTVALPAVVAIGSVWGDLVESLIKRQFAVKDAGTCLPGFGGLLDRIDSLLLVLPLGYTALVLWP